MRPVRPGGRYWFRLQPRTVPPIPSARAPEAGSTDQPTPGQEDGTTLNPAPKLVAGTADWPAPERAAGTALYPRSQTVQGTRPAPAPAAGTVREAGAEPGDGTARYGADRRLRQASNCPWITNRAAGYGQRRPDRHGGDEPRSHTNPCTNHQCLSKPDRTLRITCGRRPGDHQVHPLVRLRPRSGLTLYQDEVPLRRHGCEQLRQLLYRGN